MHAALIVWLATAGPGAAADGARPATSLTLEAALQMAWQHNNDLRAARARATAREEEVGAALDSFIPRLSVEASGNRGTTPSLGGYSSLLLRPPRTLTDTLTLGTGVQGDTPIGLTYVLEARSLTTQSDDPLSLLSSSVEPSLRLSLEQRILAFSLPSSNLASYDAARAVAAREVATVDRSTRAALADVAHAFVAVARAAALVDTRQLALDAARTLEKLTSDQIKSGAMSTVDLGLPRQSAKVRMAELAAAQLDLELARRALAARIGVPTAQLDGLGAAEPGLTAPSTDPATLRDLAARSNPSLRSVDHDLERLAAERLRAENQAAPDLRLALDAETSGLAGESNCIDGVLADGLTGCFVPSDYIGGYERAVPGAFTAQLFRVGFSVKGTFPLWPPINRARAKALVEEQHAFEEQRLGTLRTVDEEVLRTLSLVEQREHLHTLAVESSKLARDVVGAERSKLAAGRSTLFNALDTEQLVVTATAAEVRARYDVHDAIIDLLVITGHFDALGSSPAPQRGLAGPGSPASSP